MTDLDRYPPLADLGDPPEEGNEPAGWDEQQQRAAALNDWR